MSPIPYPAQINRQTPSFAYPRPNHVLDPHTLDALKAQAKAAAGRAYAPYSHFPVGAAVLTTDGQTYTGCNVENASYPLTVCGERNAVAHMVAEGGHSIAAVVIYTPTEHPSAPCGGCRQVINEFGPECQVYSFCDGPQVLDRPLADLLPDAFGPANLRH